MCKDSSHSLRPDREASSVPVLIMQEAAPWPAPLPSPLPSVPSPPVRVACPTYPSRHHDLHSIHNTPLSCLSISLLCLLPSVLAQGGRRHYFVIVRLSECLCLSNLLPVRCQRILIAADQMHARTLGGYFKGINFWESSDKLAGVDLVMKLTNTELRRPMKKPVGASKGGQELSQWRQSSLFPVMLLWFFFRDDLIKKN